MIKVLSILCLCCAFSLQATDTQTPKNNSKLGCLNDTSVFFESNWTGDDDYLYFNLDLNPELEFLDKYTIFEFKNGQGCTLYTRLKDNANLKFNGKKVISYYIDVEACNNQDNKSLACKIIHNFETESQEDGRLIKTTHTISQSTRIKNPSLDLSFEPVFSVAEDDDNNGRIVFKNSYPYSKL